MEHGHPFPERSFLISIDDGFQSSYTEAFPIIQQLHMTATIFLTVGEKSNKSSEGRLPSHEGRTMLSWREIREMHRHGITFGAHTLTHPNLNELSNTKATEEIVQSKLRIEDALGDVVTSFAYPYGRFTDRIQNIVRQHFDFACSTELGLVTLRSDPLALKRVDAYYLRTKRLFDLVPSTFFPMYIHGRNIPRRIRQRFSP